MHLKTDSPFLYAYTEMMCRHNGLANQVRRCRYRCPAHVPPTGACHPHTLRGQWLDRGLTIRYLAFGADGKESLSEPPVPKSSTAIHTAAIRAAISRCQDS